MFLFPFALVSFSRVISVYLALLVSLLTSPVGYNDIITFAQEEIEGVNASIGDEDEEQPSIKDPNLGVQLVSSDGLEFPTSMAFLGPDDILVLEKEKGTVQRIVNGEMLPTPILTVAVASQVERCMCGIAVSKSDSGSVYVFLYFTEADESGSSSILGDSYPLDLYYAYGIRNSFGFDFDPVTGNIWDTENGPGYGDEINLVEPGFNSGWLEITGFPSSSSASSDDGFDPEDDDLVSFDGKGKYSDPEFEWTVTLGPTAVKFLNSDKLGAEYVNDMFVSDVVTGRIYHFDLNEDRTELILEGTLADKVAETRDTGIEDIVFAEGFGGITDLEVGPDGYLYIVSLGHGAIYRILPSTDIVSTPDVEADVEEEEDNEDIEAVEEEEDEEEEDNDED